MNIEDFRDYCLSMEGVTEKTPFGKFARRFESILVFYVFGHMFCFVDIDDFTSVTLKSTPEEIAEMRVGHVSVGSPINMSPRHWMRIDLDGDVPDSMILSLVRDAYMIVRTKYSRSQRNSSPKSSEMPS